MDPQTPSPAPKEPRTVNRTLVWIGVAVLTLLVAGALVLVYNILTITAPAEPAPQEAPTVTKRTETGPKAVMVNGTVIPVEGRTQEEIKAAIEAQAVADPEEVDAAATREYEPGDTYTPGEVPGEPAPAGSFEIKGRVTEKNSAESFVRVYDRERGAVYTAFLSNETRILDENGAPTSFAHIPPGHSVRVITSDDPASEYDVTAATIHVSLAGRPFPQTAP